MSEATRHETVLDTDAEQVGQTYATALVAAADREGVADQVIAELNELVDEALAPNPKLRAALASPRISEEEKVRVIDRVFGGSHHPVLVKFLKVMAKRSRLAYVDAVAAAAEEIHDDRIGRIVAQVRTAVPLDDATRQEIAQRLGNMLRREVRLRESVDPDLIGGMVIRVGDRVYDSSVSNRLRQMSRNLQSGFAQQLMQSFDRFTGA